MNYKKLTPISVLAFTSLLAACGSPTAATKNNFTTAIDGILKDHNPLCYIISTQGFPLTIRKDGQFGYGTSLPQLNALVKAGVLSSKDSKTNKNFEGFGGAENSKVDAIEFDLTPTGAAAYQAKMPPNDKWPQGGAGFCLGTAAVSKIVEFTEPKMQQGGSVSEVKYIYMVKTAEPWANQPEIQKHFPDFFKAESDGLPGTIKLERGVKGWRQSRF